MLVGQENAVVIAEDELSERAYGGVVGCLDGDQGIQGAGGSDVLQIKIVAVIA